MKKAWQAPDMQIIAVDLLDVVATSDGSGGSGMFETGVDVNGWFDETGGNG